MPSSTVNFALLAATIMGGVQASGLGDVEVAKQPQVAERAMEQDGAIKEYESEKALLKAVNTKLFKNFDSVDLSHDDMKDSSGEHLPGRVNLDTLQYGYNKQIWSSYVAQPSPSCAAASAAGAYNTANGLKRKAAGALTHRVFLDEWAQSPLNSTRDARRALEKTLRKMVPEGELEGILKGLRTEMEDSARKWIYQDSSSMSTVGREKKEYTSKIEYTNKKEATDKLGTRSNLDTVEDTSKNAMSLFLENNIEDEFARVASSKDAEWKAKLASGEKMDAKQEAAMVPRIWGKQKKVPMSDGTVKDIEAGDIKYLKRHILTEKFFERMAADYAEGTWQKKFWESVNHDKLGTAEKSLGELYTAKQILFSLTKTNASTASIGFPKIQKSLRDRKLAAKDLFTEEQRHNLNKKFVAENKKEQYVQPDNKTWKTIKEALEKEGSLVNAHLSNHYALVFGWRQYDVDYIFETPQNCDSRAENKFMAQDSLADSDGSCEKKTTTTTIPRMEVLTVRAGQDPFAEKRVWLSLANYENRFWNPDTGKSVGYFGQNKKNKHLLDWRLGTVSVKEPQTDSELSRSDAAVDPSTEASPSTDVPTDAADSDSTRAPSPRPSRMKAMKAAGKGKNKGKAMKAVKGKGKGKKGATDVPTDSDDSDSTRGLPRWME